LHCALLLSGLVFLDYIGKPEKKQVPQLKTAIMVTPKALLWLDAGHNLTADLAGTVIWFSKNIA